MLWKLVLSIYSLACLAQSGQGSVRHTVRTMSNISILYWSKNSGLIFSAMVWKKYQVGSPHFICFGFGGSVVDGGAGAMTGDTDG